MVLMVQWGFIEPRMRSRTSTCTIASSADQALTQHVFNSPAVDQARTRYS